VQSGNVYWDMGGWVIRFQYRGIRVRQRAHVKDYLLALKRCRRLYVLFLLEQLHSARLRQATPRWLLGQAFDLRAA
jgi:hypothetical protein